jgi:hypothetical protein
LNRETADLSKEVHRAAWNFLLESYSEAVAELYATADATAAAHAKVLGAFSLMRELQNPDLGMVAPVGLETHKPLSVVSQLDAETAARRSLVETLRSLGA